MNAPDTPPSWAAEQQAFWEWITQPQDLRQQQPAIEALISPPQGIASVDALAIYNNAYHQRLLQIAAELYPVTLHALGSEIHSQLWLEYLSVYPPRPGPMSLLSEHLPAFVQQHPSFGKLPALISLIELETLLIQLFDRADDAKLTTADLKQIDPINWGEMYLTPCGDWALLHSPFDLEAYWTRIQEHRANLAADTNEVAAAPFAVPRHMQPDGVYYLVRRVQLRMQFQQINAAMQCFLAAARAGENFAQICETLAERYPDQDIAALSLQLLLKATELGLFKKVPEPDPAP